MSEEQALEIIELLDAIGTGIYIVVVGVFITAGACICGR